MSFFRFLVVAGVLAGAIHAGAQQPKDFAVMLSASITVSPQPRIELSWAADTAQQKVYIWKKLKTDAMFPVAIHDSVLGKTVRWTDNNVQKGVSYEYRVFRLMRRQTGVDTTTKQPIFTVFYGTGYINSGIEAAPVPRERVLLLVDTTMMAPLASGIDLLKGDLENEGWEVTVRGVPRAETFDSAKVRTTMEIVRAEWNAGPRDLGGIILLGRVPVPYSGNIVPDGHPDHQGAWPADGIYGDINGTYTDNLTTSPNGVRAANANAPRDGKFDQSQFSTDVDVPVGRIDFYDMPAFSKSETELLRDYLIKNHAYRTNQWNVAVGGIIDDNFGTYGEVFAASGWRSFSVFGGDTVIKAGDFFTDLAGPKNYLLAYGCGGGTDNSAGGIGSTNDMASKPVHGVFTLLFGSYFGDYNTQNNFLRATIAAAPRTLTCGWSGRPHWYLHHMALGETVGYSAMISQNNRIIVSNNFGNYVPNVLQTPTGLSVAGAGDRGVHIALMGDPTLRAVTRPVAVLSTLTVSQGPWNTINLTWVRPSGDAQAYMVYRRKGGDRRWTLLTPQPITSVTYKDSIIYEGTLEYLVRCCALRTTASGSFYDMGKGRVASIITTDVAEERGPIGFAPPFVAATPSPAATEVSLSIGLEQPSNVELLLVDLRGIEVWRMQLPSLSAGRHHQAIDVSTLPSGVYMLHARSSMGTAVHAIRVAR